MSMMMNRVPASAGTFRVVREKKLVHGRMRRVGTLVFTTPDGYVGEAAMTGRPWPELQREAYEGALAARAAAQYRVAMAAPKPAPLAPLLTALKDTVLCAEMERRGYEVCLP